jgi:hypothetical protein
MCTRGRLELNCFITIRQLRGFYTVQVDDFSRDASRIFRPLQYRVIDSELVKTLAQYSSEEPYVSGHDS